MYARGIFDERNRPAMFGALMEELMRSCNQLPFDPFSAPEPAPVTTNDEIMETIKRINRGDPIDLKAFPPHQLVIHLKLFFYFSCDSLLPSSDTIDGEVAHGYTPMFVRVNDGHSLEYNTTSISYFTMFWTKTLRYTFSCAISCTDTWPIGIAMFSGISVGMPI